MINDKIIWLNVIALYSGFNQYQNNTLFTHLMTNLIIILSTDLKKYIVIDFGRIVQSFASAFHTPLYIVWLDLFFFIEASLSIFHKMPISRGVNRCFHHNTISIRFIGQRYDILRYLKSAAIRFRFDSGACDRYETICPFNTSTTCYIPINSQKTTSL